MIQPWEKKCNALEREEDAAGYRTRLSAVPNSDVASHCWQCGWEDADTEALELLVTGGFLLRTGKTSMRPPRGSSSMLDGMPGRMGSPSMKAGRNPGKRAGSTQTSIWGWQGRENRREAREPEVDAGLPDLCTK